MYKYKTVIYWSEEDQCYIAKAPDLPGCIAHGDTDELALMNIKEAIKLWIETSEGFGDLIPAPKEHCLVTA